MIDQLSDLQKQKQELQEKIRQKFFEFFDKNDYIKKLVTRLDNGEYDRLEANDLNGVDYCVDLDAKQLAMIGVNMSEIIDYLEDWITKETTHHYNRGRNEIVSSTGDEIFIQPWKNMILLPEISKIKFVEYEDEFHCWLLAEEWMAENGIYPGLYKCDFYGGISEWKWSDEIRKYAEFFPQDEKPRITMLNQYIALYSSVQILSDSSVSLSDIPALFYDLLPKEVRKMEEEGDIELMDIVEITVNKVVMKIGVDSDLEFSYGEKLDDGNYLLKVLVIPNSIHWIKEA